MGITEKVPPQSVEVEKSVLGSALINKDVRASMVENLTEDYFYSRQNRMIFNTIKKLYKLDTNVDLVILANDLRTNEILTAVGGETYLSELVTFVATVTNIDNYIGILEHAKLERDWIEISSNVQSVAYGKEPHNDKLEKILNFISPIGATSGKGEGLVHVKDIIPAAAEDFQKAMDGVIKGIKTGIEDFDRETGGIFLGENTIIAGRPGDGKTTIALSVAKCTASQGYPTGILSMEMKKKKLTNRLALSLGDGVIKNEHLRGVAAPSVKALEDYSMAMDKLSKLDIYIDDSANMSIGTVLTSVRAFIRKHKIKVLVFDHFSLLGYDGENKKGAAYERKEEISRGVARIIKEEEVAGLTLVQLGRDAQNRRPRLSDLSDTKALEQDANNVLMIWNPVHGDKTRRVLCCEKGRDGGSGDYYINFEGDTAKTYSMEPQEQEAYYSEIEKSANHSHRG